MPEISRFFGIIIRMYVEPTQHNRPHFHAYYQDSVSVIAIDEIEVIAGNLPRKQLRLAIAWAELHQAELMEDWNKLQKGKLPKKIEPIK
ncbi:MAG: hypothetical protein A3H98_07515 [Bacteroidetes bacterium RIFCSPLOWO2_02_FULL_36_8]|nr:MAG: hypothetical protein A3H98_07515 [Bacteroidetes bacterium RIFCSPLOWO2_02_FULL_36_8]OFY71644.1 MAG: hypothetical protein A3G23_00365 [Bacteroidetes bacterium RIFCSPLOWO2_12_FULL_37_12]